MKQLLPVAALLLLVWSCSVNVREAGPVVNDNERLVTLSLATPSTPASRALASLTTTQEDEVHEVDVLLFKDEDFFYRAIGVMKTGDEFTVKLPSHTDPYKVVVLANARSILSAIPAAQEQTGTSRATILDGLTHALAGQSAVNAWTGNLASGGIPMWGYHKSLRIDATTGNPAATIGLTRMIAKVDITMENTVNNFTLESARLYNYSTKGTIAPAVSTTDAEGYTLAQWKLVDSKFKAIAPHLPPGAGVSNDAYLEYILDPTASGTVIQSIGQIYAYEAMQGTDGTITNTCLVIGGYYDGSTSPTYYRVEFAETDGSEFYHILRNHHYNVVIKRVDAAGYSTPHDAYINRPANITVTITDWNNAGLGDVIFTPQYHLSVDKTELSFYLDNGPKSLTVDTDYPAGWVLQEIPAWLDTITGARGPANTETLLTLQPNAVIPKTDTYFYIVAGNLKKTIHVKHLDENELSLEVNPTTLTFYKTPVPKTVALTPYGGRTDIPNPFAFSTAGPLTWHAGYDPTVTTNLNTILVSNATLTLYPGVNDTGSAVGGAVTVLLNGEQGKTVSRSINITQLGSDMVFTPTGTLNYAATAGSHTFNVNSPDATWKLTDATNATYLTLTDEDGDYHPATTSAFTYHFTLASNANSFHARSVTLEATSTNPEFYPTPATKPSVTITQAAGASPAINITNRETPYYTFPAAAPFQKTVDFTTNAPWKITTSTYYTDVVSEIKASDNSATITIGATQATTGTPSSAQSTSVFVHRAAAGMAGSATTTLTFSTDVGGGVTEDSETVNFQHTNPVVFNVTPSPAVGTDIGINATNIVLTATNVNIPWWGRRGTDAADNIPTTVNPFNTPQASDQITVPIPARLWQDASSWTGEILVQAGYGAYNGVSALATPQSFTFNRTPYTLDVDNISPSTLGGFGGNVTMDVTTNAEAYTLRFTGAGTAIDVTENPAQTSTSVTIPANTSSTTRTIEIVNFYDPTTTLASFTQDGTPNYILYGPYATVPAFTLDPPCPTSYSRSNVGLVTGVESTIMLNSTGAAPAVNRYYFTGNEVSGSGRRLMYIDVTNTTPATGQHNLYVTAGTANNPYSATYNGLWYIVCMRDQNP